MRFTTRRVKRTNDLQTFRPAGLTDPGALPGR